jgi:hypothetical protein
MLKLNQNGQAVEAYEYDQDHTEMQRPISNVRDYSNVEFTNEKSASIPRGVIKRTKTANPKNVQRQAMRKNFERNVSKEQYFSGTNYAAVEAALNQVYEFNPNLAEFGPITDYPQIVNAKRNMNFNGQPQMGGIFDEWFQEETGIDVGYQFSNEELKQGAVAVGQATGLIPSNVTPPKTTVVAPPKVNTGSLASTIPGVTSLSSFLPASLSLKTKKAIVYGIYGVVGLLVVSTVVSVVKNLIPKRA